MYKLIEQKQFSVFGKSHLLLSLSLARAPLWFSVRAFSVSTVSVLICVFKSAGNFSRSNFACDRCDFDQFERLYKQGRISDPASIVVLWKRRDVFLVSLLHVNGGPSEWNLHWNSCCLANEFFIRQAFVYMRKAAPKNHRFCYVSTTFFDQEQHF